MTRLKLTLTSHQDTETTCAVTQLENRGNSLDFLKQLKQKTTIGHKFSYESKEKNIVTHWILLCSHLSTASQKDEIKTWP